MKPRLTIGMAHHSDYDGVYFSIQAIRAYHSAREVELIVVDNSPYNEHGRAVADLVTNWARGRYIAMPENVGTTQPRERIFREASADYVVCMDCHVLLVKDAVDALLAHYEAHPESQDIINGPMFYDDGRNLTTHFNEEWRSEMLGTWGLAWDCECGRLRFSPVHVAGRAEYWTLSSPQRPIREPTASLGCICGSKLPDLPWAGHEAALCRAGFSPIVKPGERPFTASGEPVAVPGCGLGCFSMRKAAWPGFNPHFLQFGGEEIYIHEKVRRAGGQALCLPEFGWIHRFARVNGVKYPLTRYAKVRNYVLGFQELGWDLGPIHKHFVSSGLMPEEHWQWLLADPVDHIGWRFTASGIDAAKTEAPAKPCAPQQPPPPPLADDATLDQVFAFVRATPRDLDQHVDKLRELAVGDVVEITKRRESTIALLAGQPDSLTSFQREQDKLFQRVPKLAGRTRVTVRQPDAFGLPDVPECDTLFLDDVHTADRLWAQLSKFAPLVRRRIIMRGTAAFGERAEGMDAPGLLVALRRYLRDHPDWSVVYHTGNQYGLTVISRDPSDKPELPGVIKLAANFAKALAEHVADGAQKCTAEQLERRLEICTLCDQRRDDRCTVCGCYVHAKASWRTSQCPLARWPALEVETPDPPPTP